ncbi:MAG: hypothetical protein JWN78_3067 [Bacteroidota bacterium]|nr:hypothetical protein [Bacteroidota bacterium]
MKNSYSLLILFFLLSVSTKASNPNKLKTEGKSKGTSFIFLTGINFAKVHDPKFSPDDLDDDEKIVVKPGVLVGVGINFAFNRYISLEPELLFSQKGIKDVWKSGRDKETYTETYNYLEMPIMINGGYSNSKFEAFGSIGASVGFWISAKTKDVTIISGEKDVEKDKLDLTKNTGSSIIANRVEAAIHAGFGAGYKIKGMAIGLELRGSIGMTGLERKSKDAPSYVPKPTKLTNRVISLCLYLKLGNKPK